LAESVLRQAQDDKQTTVGDSLLATIGIINGIFAKGKQKIADISSGQLIIGFPPRHTNGG
jgi:hypothetical protein